MKRMKTISDELKKQLSFKNDYYPTEKKLDPVWKFYRSISGHIDGDLSKWVDVYFLHSRNDNNKIIRISEQTKKPLHILKMIKKIEPLAQVTYFEIEYKTMMA